MGNICAGPNTLENGFFKSISNAIWPTRPPEKILLPPPPPQQAKIITGGIGDAAPAATAPKPLESPLPVENKPPEPVKIATKEKEFKPVDPKKSHNIGSVSNAGLQIDSVLKRKTENLKEIYSLGRKLGQGQFGTTYLCLEKATGKEYACKSIMKRKLLTEEDVEDVRREIQLMHHLGGHPNIISITGAYEDAVAIHVVMELCAGGELFDRIIQRGHYTESKAAELARVIVGIVEACHSLGVMHRDLKPENFLFINQTEESLLKMIDFGLSIFFKPGKSSKIYFDHQ